MGLPEVVREELHKNIEPNTQPLAGPDIYEIFILSLRILYAHPAMLRFGAPFMI
jgi:hypothetical protein